MSATQRLPTAGALLSCVKQQQLYCFTRFFENAFQPTCEDGMAKGAHLQQRRVFNVNFGNRLLRRPRGGRRRRRLTAYGCRHPSGPTEQSDSHEKETLSSHPPGNQCSLSARRVTIDSVDSLSAQAGLLRDLSDARSLLLQHGPHLYELLACQAWLAPKISALTALLGVLDASPLRRLGGLISA